MTEIVRAKHSREKWRAVVREMKESSPCIDCGNYFPYYVMQYDHLDGSEKVQSVNWLLRNSNLKAALEEIKKCVLICANCHAIRTWKRQHKIEVEENGTATSN